MDINKIKSEIINMTSKEILNKIKIMKNCYKKSHLKYIEIENERNGFIGSLVYIVCAWENRQYIINTLTAINLLENELDSREHKETFSQQRSETELPKYQVERETV